jgi:hypothetical protein
MPRDAPVTSATLPLSLVEVALVLMMCPFR